MLKNRVAIVCALGAILPAFMFLRAIETGASTDFKYFWDAGRTVLEASNLPRGFPYPPHSLFLFTPFALLPMGVANAVFNVLGLAFFLWAARPYGLPPYLAAALPAVLTCLLFGQTGLIVGGLWLLAFRGGWPAVALLTFKPHMGLLSALSLTRRTVAPTIALALVLIVASALVFGRWFQFIVLLTNQAEAIATDNKWPIIGVGPAIGYGFFGWVIFALAALWVLRLKVDAFTAATASLVVSPYAFHYDMPVASLGLALALQRTSSPFRVIAFVLALLLPTLVRFGAWMAPPILLWALWCQCTEEAE